MAMLSRMGLKFGQVRNFASFTHSKDAHKVKTRFVYPNVHKNSWQPKKDKKEAKRLARAAKHINKYDPASRGDTFSEATWPPERIKPIFEFSEQLFNNNRHVRKQMPLDLKKKFAEESYDYSLLKVHEFQLI